MIVDLGFGSNLGDRHRHLQDGVDALRKDCRVIALSSVYETAPVGGPPQPPYLNAVVRIDSDRSPRELLDMVREIEDAAGRVRGDRWGPRELDVDILRFGSLAVDEPDLVIPHPRLAERAFVLVPLSDVDPSVELGSIDTHDVKRVDLELF